MDEKAIRRAALVTVRRGYSSDSRLGLRVERGCDGRRGWRNPQCLSNGRGFSNPNPNRASPAQEPDKEQRVQLVRWVKAQRPAANERLNPTKRGYASGRIGLRLCADIAGRQPYPR